MKFLFRTTLAAMALFFAAASSALAAPQTSSDWFAGAAITPPGAATPVQIVPTQMTRRADGATGIGYQYRARGQAVGQIPGPFTYEEHGYLYFSNPADVSSLIGSTFVSGVFTLNPTRGGAITIADTAPANYISGIQTLAMKLTGQQRKKLN